MIDTTIDTSVSNVFFKFVCEKCDYKCKTNQHFNKHINTDKHIRLTNIDKKVTRVDGIYSCACGKEYKFRQSLHVHKKTCNKTSVLVDNYSENTNGMSENTNGMSENTNGMSENTNGMSENTNGMSENTNGMSENTNGMSETNLIIDLLTELKLEREQHQEQQSELLRRNEEQQNQMMDLQHQFLEAIKNGSLGNTTNSNNNNTQNNQFNLQFYLNETCKDAINLDEFLQSIQLTSQDYVNTGEVGFITGLTDIFRKELHKLEPHNRPLQCTDVKREVIYVKENDKWAKDIENKKTKNIVRRIDLSYQRMMYQWMKENPEHVEEEGPLVEEGIKYSTVCLGNNRLNGNEPIFRNKIFTNILDDIAIKKGNKVITVES